MKIIEKYECMIPTWALSAIINSDNSGLEEKDIDQIEQFDLEMNNIAKSINATHSTISYPANIDNEQYFSPYNELHNLGDTVIDITVNFFK
jgi:hypothetical protein